MSKKEFIDEAVVSDRTSPMTNPMTKDSMRSAEAVGEGAPHEARPGVVVVPEKRRRYSSQEKMELVRLTYLPGNTVSSIARAHGVAPSMLFRWRALDKQGALTAIQAGEGTVSARKYEAALEEIKRLQRLLGQATADNALLKDAVEYMQSKKWIAR